MQVFAPGFRLGWVAGPTRWVHKYQLLQEMTAQFPSGVSQAVFLGMVQTWGEEGLHAHVARTQTHYRAQRDAMLEELLRGLGSLVPRLVRVDRPSGGMFLWMEVAHPALRSSEELFLLLAKVKVITVPGSDFFVASLCASDTKDLCWQPPSTLVAVRLSFAFPTTEQIREGARLIASTLKATIDKHAAIDDYPHTC